MTTKNTRNARLLLCLTAGGTYVPVNKTHGLQLNIATDFSEDTGHGQRFKTYIPGLQDFKLTVSAWYDTAYPTLEAASLNKLTYYAQIYPDYADPLNYYWAQVYIGQEEFNLDLGNTADQGYTVVLANETVSVIRNGTAL